jgi:hypothetical protein
MGQRKTIMQTGAWSPSWGYSLEASASMAKYPTSEIKRNGTTILSSVTTATTLPFLATAAIIQPTVINAAIIQPTIIQTKIK